MITVRVPAWGRLFTLKGNNMPELLKRAKQSQSNPPESATSIVTRSGERVGLKDLISEQEDT